MWHVLSGMAACMPEARKDSEAEVSEAMVERLDDLELVQLAKARLDAGESRVRAKVVGDDIVFEEGDVL
ncbi:hypothetical protein HW090_03400 [Pseudomonas sp. ABC1]|uniref:hypothetical protein n=1 Tax=Pseudomonas sp. ABC1 TaxID=2748080 RepID=UPI0015C32DB1|nr:hypothetical protein [Pseudomonas sp. ABC1]QLF92297.1 hypothetical protein HW090_03400 [Pseudomonas sp. ABC1]